MLDELDLLSALSEVAGLARNDPAHLPDDEVNRARNSDDPYVRAAALVYQVRQLITEMKSAQALDLLADEQDQLLKADHATDSNRQHLHWWFHHMYADVLDDLGLCEQARDQWLAAAAVADRYRITDVWLRSSLNLVYHHRLWGAPHEAMTIMQSIVERLRWQQPDPFVLQSLADLHIDSKLPETAYEYAKRANELIGSSKSRGRRLQTDALILLGDLAEAEVCLAWFEEAAITASERYLTSFCRWRWLMASARYEDALFLSRDIIDVFENSGRLRTQWHPYVIRAQSLGAMGRMADAANVLAELADARLSNFDQLMVLELQSNIHEAEGDLDEAITALEAHRGISEVNEISTVAIVELHRSLADMGYASALGETYFQDDLGSAQHVMTQSDMVLLAAAKDLRTPLGSLLTASAILSSLGSQSNGSMQTALVAGLKAKIEQAVAELELATNLLSAIQVIDDYTSDGDTCMLGAAAKDPVRLTATVGAVRSIEIVGVWPQIEVVGRFDMVRQLIESVLWLVIHHAESGSAVEVGHHDSENTIVTSIAAFTRDNIAPSWSSNGTPGLPHQRTAQAASLPEARAVSIFEAAKVLGADLLFEQNPETGRLVATLKLPTPPSTAGRS